MSATKTDPRILRTRKLIMDAFIKLSGQKEFKDITINDITTEATINRATFYYHFTDKYELLEKVLLEVFMVNLNSEFDRCEPLDEAAITQLFLAIISFQTSLSNRCWSGYEETIETIIKNQLEVLFYRVLCNMHSKEQDDSLRMAAVVLSWGIYGASLDWQRNRSMEPEKYIKKLMPFMMNGVGSLVKTR